MPDPQKLVRRVVVEGFVQGVGYRQFAWRAARRLGLCGWVRNRSDGTVEAVIAGPPDAVEAMLADLRRGPPGAQVRTVRLHEALGEEWPRDAFEVRATD
ncbi:acylphosphatase [Roseiarcus fermentans]|uniref:acylphosphatase n=1 Tax=Roseiarcus fermentans TaxID=1473586 RepID=A0A366F3G6_9HYPH|nr:acylphosphatase [Roseiarcus fermentans]RBP09137.1 acylphosphatase [Roseiarcus fermentans]